MSLLPLIAERLRQLREQHGLTQNDAAALIGITARFYQMIESGKKRWLETVERLAAGFGIEVWQLLGPSLPAKTEMRIVSAKNGARRGRRGPYRKHAANTSKLAG